MTARYSVRVNQDAHFESRGSDRHQAARLENPVAGGGELLLLRWAEAFLHRVRNYREFKINFSTPGGGPPNGREIDDTLLNDNVFLMGVPFGAPACTLVNLCS